MPESSRRVKFGFREMSMDAQSAGMSDEMWGLYSRLTSSLEATHAKKTAASESPPASPRPASEASSCGLLERFARRLSCGKTRRESAPTLPGLGGDSGTGFSVWDTESSRSGSARVALALTINGTGCSCSPRFPTPSASSHNRVKDVAKLKARRDRQRALGRNGNGFGLNLGQHCAIRGIPFTVELLEDLMGFPRGWADSSCEATETPSRP